MSKKPLKFSVAPHLVQDLGLNLYTSLPKVLVEFIANAYDADSPAATITIDIDAIQSARKVVKKEWDLAKAKAERDGKPPPKLDDELLPEEVTIVIEDAGHGMTRQELQDKFLVAGRRRRDEDKTMYSPGNRVVMGRKGLGKLAGFGVAHQITIESKVAREKEATQVILDFDKILKAKNMDGIEIFDEALPDGGGFETQGTRIILSRLQYEPMGSRLNTIQNMISTNFVQIDPDDFEISLNGDLIKPLEREFSFAWPEPDLANDELVSKSLDIADRENIDFAYRIRFTMDGEALSAKERGVRVYAHKRLAAASSLLDADTNMHGFRMTDYLDGVVYADFLDDESTDYIATDRQDLRWDAQLLVPLREFLSKEIKIACAERQKRRDVEKEDEVANDEYTKQLIFDSALSKKEEKVAFKMAKALATLHKQGLTDEGYKTQLSEVLTGMGRGELLQTLSLLAAEGQPQLAQVALEVARLTAEEFDGFVRFVRGRLDGIIALSKIVQASSFREGRDEKEIQKLLEGNPWIIDPMFSQFLTADQYMEELFDRLAQHLKISKYSRTAELSKRPDLVFLIGSKSLQRLVIVELKASNIKLDSEHLGQLEVYMDMAESWLRTHASGLTFQIHGELIGTMPEDEQSGKGHILLRRRMREAGPQTPWRVRDYMTVLLETKSAHEEILSVARKREKAGKAPD